MYQGAFLMRRLESVRGEFSLTALAYNIRRAITLVGVSGLIAAIPSWPILRAKSDIKRRKRPRGALATADTGNFPICLSQPISIG